MITGTLLFIVIPAVDGGTFRNYYTPNDRAPLSKHVKQYVKTYIQHNSKNLSSIKKRSSSPFLVIDSVFRRFGLPEQLKYLAVVESELKTKAVSRVGAVGPWQLMPKTARILGLKVNSHTDERKSYYKSTRAAARYLKDLHVQFGDWFLVFAAYNSGEGTVNAAIRQSGSRNFWALQRYLPVETREYVQKYIATCYYFEGSYSQALLQKSAGDPYSTKLLGDLRTVKLNVQDTAPKKNETPEEKFNRLLQESEKSLKKSDLLLSHRR